MSLPEYEQLKIKLSRITAVSQKLLGLDTQVCSISQSCEYSDKFSCVETLIDSMIACVAETLNLIGIGSECITELYKKKPNGKIYLTLKSEEECSFKEKVEKSTEIQKSTGNVERLLNFVVSKVKVSEYWKWNYKYSHRAYLSTGSNSNEEPIQVWSGSGTATLETTTDLNPRSRNTIHQTLEVDITWFGRSISQIPSNFTINKNSPFCFTPTNNEEVSKMLIALDKLVAFFHSVDLFFSDINDLHPNTATSLVVLPSDVLSDIETGLPVLPLVNLNGTDSDLILTSFKQSLQNQISNFAAADNVTVGLVQMKEATIVASARMITFLSEGVKCSIKYLEGMTLAVISHIVSGEITPSELDSAICWYLNKNILNDKKHHLKALMFPIRSLHSHPEGMLEIIDFDTGKTLHTVCRTIERAKQSWSFSLSATAKVVCDGQILVNGFVSNVIKNSNSNKVLSLSSNQISSYVVILGKLSGVGEVIVSHALIVRNRESFSIPLSFTEIPSAEEFQEAISSLSPEQQRFANAYRSMQLEGTLFTVGVIHIKPQLESVLNLPQGALTKEIDFSQDILSCMITRQVSADFLCANSESSIPPIEQVRSNYERINRLIQLEKEDELKDIARSKNLEKLRLAAVDLETRKQWRESYIKTTWSANFVSSGSMCLAPAKCRSGGGGGFFSRSSKSSGPQKLRKRKVAMSAAPIASNSGISVKKKDEAPKLEIPPPKPSEPEKPTPEPEMPLPEPAPEVIQEQESESTTNNTTVGIHSIVSSSTTWDYSLIPTQLENRFLEVGKAPCSQLRPVTITPNPSGWKKCEYKSILSAASPPKILKSNDVKSHKESALTLLDALTKSGNLPLCETSLYVLFGFNCSWSDSIIQSSVRHNINPIHVATNAVVEIANVLHEKKVA